MRRSIFALAVAFLLAATPVFSAQGGPKPNPAPATPSASVKKPATTTKMKPVSAASAAKAPKVQKSSVKAAKSTTTRPVKSTTKSATKSAKAATTSETKTATSKAKADAKAAKEQKSTASTDTTAGDGTTTPDTGDSVPLTPVQEKLKRNTNLASKLERKLEGRLPAGTDLMDAALGFKNLGQFVAAVNVSTNLQLDFIELKTRMVDQNMSLGQAIQDLKATASPTVEAQRAEYDARVMIAASETEASASVTTTTAGVDTTARTKKPKKSNKKAVGGAE